MSTFLRPLFSSVILVASLSVSQLMAAPGKLDTGRRAQRLSTTEEAVLPGVMPVERQTVLQEQREEQLSSRRFEGKEAIVGERRSSIDVTETREKRWFRTPEKKTYETVTRKDATISTKETRFSTREDVYRTRTAERFQEKIAAAQPAFKDSKPVVSKRTSWNSINRFAFRKNSDQTITVTKAGSEAAPTPADPADVQAK